MSKPTRLLQIDLFNISFKDVLLDWGFGYPELAGCSIEHPTDDDIAEGSCLLPESGDMVVFNAREQGEYLGMDHAELIPYDVYFKESSPYYNENLMTPKNMRDVSTCELWERYQRISVLFCDYAMSVDDDEHHDLGFDSKETLMSSYEEEILTLSDDFHLGFYWLLLFGLLGKQSYFDRTFKECDKGHRLIAECVEFFRDDSFLTSIDLSVDSHDEKEKIFFKDHAFQKRITSLKKQYT